MEENNETSLLKEKNTIRSLLVVGIICFILGFITCLLLIKFSFKYYRDYFLSKTEKKLQVEFDKSLSTISPSTAFLEGDILVSAENRTTFYFPKGSFSKKTDLSYGYNPGCLVPKGMIRSAGIDTYLKLMNGPDFNPLKPFTITMNYENVSHLNEKTLAIYVCSETNVNPEYVTKLLSKVDLEKKTVTADYQKYGSFGLIGELKCPNDIREYYDDQSKILGGQDISFNQPSRDLFDSEKDVDWYFINLKKDKKYTIETINVTQGVIPIIELSTNGVDNVQDNKNNPKEKLIVNPNLFSDYIQIKLAPSNNSKVGCDANYDLLVTEN